MANVTASKLFVTFVSEKAPMFKTSLTTQLIHPIAATMVAVNSLLLMKMGKIGTENKLYRQELLLGAASILLGIVVSDPRPELHREPFKRFLHDTSRFALSGFYTAELTFHLINIYHGEYPEKKGRKIQESASHRIGERLLKILAFYGSTIYYYFYLTDENRVFNAIIDVYVVIHVIVFIWGIGTMCRRNYSIVARANWFAIDLLLILSCTLFTCVPRTSAYWNMMGGHSSYKSFGQACIFGMMNVRRCLRAIYPYIGQKAAAIEFRKKLNKVVRPTDVVLAFFTFLLMFLGFLFCRDFMRKENLCFM